MGNRLTKIYTKTGDTGTTGLADGSRVDKDSLRIDAIGTIDEVSSCIGVVVELLSGVSSHTPILQEIQQRLFDLGGELAYPERKVMCEEMVEDLENALDHLNNQLKPLENFILPGGNLCSAHTHMARSICRRAERTLVSLQKQEPLNPAMLKYINRLSDYLFVLARTVCLEHGDREILWQPYRR
ncbi:ATP--cobalamin adenosyltransferase [Oleiphilus messinensis]|uniref:Corrinoid adenosyltransferase n=1 Tax=Oleiphilus messinensis TaxID=141451 RepID=A0A1Y0IAR5_9GAMM|nr:cob(I)yrinic acid a,c-diamide adenosyltransferase [Oleiphilus messinensis]ARU57622.1 ATP--cobalamin adenosyltransferase [Oleiphilus messinensis]